MPDVFSVACPGCDAEPDRFCTEYVPEVGERLSIPRCHRVRYEMFNGTRDVNPLDAEAGFITQRVLVDGQPVQLRSWSVPDEDEDPQQGRNE